ncbi:Fis family transcriptional regulator [Caballeronia jiangsuensis]|nr:Fis family transcriptional regulator [Caballeronia jiangsuensis]
MSVKRHLRIGASIGLLAFAHVAQAFDVLYAEHDISATPAGAFSSVCAFDGAPRKPLQFAEAVERALCGNPQTRSRWADVKAQAAAVGTARAAYLPTLSANWQGQREHSVIDVRDHPTLSSDMTSTVRSVGANLTWTLFDFGARSAALNSANAQLDAARALQDATLQTVFALTAKDYYATQTAIGASDAARDIELMTRQTMLAAQARVDKGIAPVTDALQAQTQHEQALVALTKAESDAQTALGSLAADMALDPSVPLDVPAIKEVDLPGQTFAASIEEMIDQVKQGHPSVRAAQAQYEAAVAKITQTSAQGAPSISLIAKYNRNNQPQSIGLGQPSYPSTGHDAYIGVQVSIPLFEGFSRHYQVDQARAQAERQQDVLDDARQRVALDVWTSYQSLNGATRNMQNNANLLAIAGRAWEAARRRYDAGVGNILELMNTQSALANAKQQRLRAVADWEYARVDLASKLGVLGQGDLLN